MDITFLSPECTNGFAKRIDESNNEEELRPNALNLSGGKVEIKLGNLPHFKAKVKYARYYT
jgi:hypothetical protein